MRYDMSIVVIIVIVACQVDLRWKLRLQMLKRKTTGIRMAHWTESQTAHASRVFSPSIKVVIYEWLILEPVLGLGFVGSRSRGFAVKIFFEDLK